MPFLKIEEFAKSDSELEKELEINNEFHIFINLFQFFFAQFFLAPPLDLLLSIIIGDSQHL